MNIVKLKMENYDRIWIISDIHGYHNLFLKLMDRIKLTAKDLLIINGDSCDRGSSSLEMYETIEELIDSGLNIIHTFGNHENLMVNAIEDGELFAWYRNGGRQTIDSYKKRYDILNKHLKYIKNMPIAVDLGKYFVVHAGINPKKTIERQIPYEMIWIRNDFINQPILKTDKIIVYGHTPNLDGKIHFVDDQKISIDCGSYDTGVLGAIELKRIEIIYESTDRLNIYLNQHFKKR
ncbi:metallophosphoesterase family protein [Psychrilyobacter sp.]|uniref:metallophosphoesterase family protein n=1 Tax=Psychrilyobacter sp. TaxID=2586924 RepID=UPI003018512D